MDRKLLKRGEGDLLSGCFLFRNTKEEIFQRTLEDERCRLIEAKRGDVISDVFDYRNSLGIVLSGRIEVTKPSSRRYMMSTLSKGSVFGAANLYDEALDCVTVLKAAAGCRMVFFPRALLEALMCEDDMVAKNYIRFLTGRVKFLNDKIQGLVSESAEAALAQYLTANMAQRGGKTVFRPLGSMSLLAEELNIGRASLYRAFDSLENIGLIRKNGKEIEITDLNGLSNIK
jgi:CRP-like cAMP-binding protein